MGVLVIAVGKTFIFRSALFVGLGSVVATIIYLTPVPGQTAATGSLINLPFPFNHVDQLIKAVVDQYPQSCSRTCHELDWPMICRVKLTLEHYQTLSRACGDCPRNGTHCYGKYCVTGDGRKRGILTANRQFPGPNLRVCQNDLIVVDIVNRVPGQSFSVHWRGQSQRESPFMDGVPMITQCPIPSFTTFQYKFRATHAGTHMWQVNTGEELLETLFGGFIVRKPDSREIHRELYDLEDPAHVIVVHTLSYPPKLIRNPSSSSVTKLLINGKVEENGFPPEVFRVAPGRRYRFRVIFGGDSNGCMVHFTIEDHELLILALDGNPIKPKNVTSIHFAQGERVDFVLRADQQSSSYRMTAVPDQSCKSVTEASAMLLYEGTRHVVNKIKSTSSTELSTVSDKECEGGGAGIRLCPGHIESLTPIPKELLARDPKHTFYLFYTVRSVSSQTIYNTTFIAVEDKVKIPQVNNVTMMFPSSPLLTQAKDVSSSVLCNGETLPKSCLGREMCECIHILSIKLGATVELVLVNQDEEKSNHAFHLHGYHFHLVGSDILTETMTPEEIRALDKDNKLIYRNLNSPVFKDTVTVPFNGVSVLRFKADNPGYWLLGEEHSSGWSRGMSTVLHVGKDSDLHNTPNDFPKCGNWIGPEFFLE